MDKSQTRDISLLRNCARLCQVIVEAFSLKVSSSAIYGKGD